MGDAHHLDLREIVTDSVRKLEVHFKIKTRDLICKFLMKLCLYMQIGVKFSR